MAAPVTDTVFRELLERMVSARQLSASDAQALADAPPKNIEAGEEGILRWLAGEYGVSFTNLEEVQTDKELLSLFPARIKARSAPRSISSARSS
jgi:hypothetical protein